MLGRGAHMPLMLMLWAVVTEGSPEPISWFIDGLCLRGLKQRVLKEDTSPHQCPPLSSALTHMYIHHTYVILIQTITMATAKPLKAMTSPQQMIQKLTQVNVTSMADSYMLSAPSSLSLDL